MGLFENIDTGNAKRSEDRVGGGFQPLETGVYSATIKMAYAGQAPNSPAQNVTVILDIDGKEVSETIYYTNKNKEAFYIDKKTKEQMKLPGYMTLDDICLFATETPLIEQDTDTKVVKVYDPNERKEVNTEVPALVDLIGKEIQMALSRVVEFKRKQVDGAYVTTDETRTYNTIEKVMHPETGRTINEYQNEVTEPVYRTEFIERRAGKDKDLTKRGPGAKSEGGKSGSGSPFQKKASTSLFGNKS
jgi:hypothetical protein